MVNAITYTASGTYTQNFINSKGCDSILTVNATINLPTTATINPVGCNSVTVNATTYTATGTYIQNLTNTVGCDSTLTINATINSPTTATINPVGCSSVAVNAITYTATGTYTQNFINSKGCDSILTVNATINMPTTATISPAGCNIVTVNAITYTATGTYTQNFTNAVGCDSTLTINATINLPTTATINPVGCGSIMVNSTTYTASGTYTQNLISLGGCDSTITINILLNTTPSVSYTLTNVAPYTWDAYPTYSTNVDSARWSWGDGTSTAGLYPSHTYSVTGRYNICVTVTDTAGCTATSCQNDSVYRASNNSPLSSMVYINVLNNNQTTGIAPLSVGEGHGLRLYPNPNNGSFAIEPDPSLTLPQGKGTLMQVYDVNGRLVLSQTINGKTNIDANSLNEGVYNISLLSNDGVVNKRLVIVR